MTLPMPITALCADNTCRKVPLRAVPGRRRTANCLSAGWPDTAKPLTVVSTTPRHCATTETTTPRRAIYSWSAGYQALPGIPELSPHKEKVADNGSTTLLKAHSRPTVCSASGGRLPPTAPDGRQRRSRHGSTIVSGLLGGLAKHRHRRHSCGSAAQGGLRSLIPPVGLLGGSVNSLLVQQHQQQTSNHVARHGGTTAHHRCGGGIGGGAGAKNSTVSLVNLQKSHTFVTLDTTVDGATNHLKNGLLLYDSCQSDASESCDPDATHPLQAINRLRAGSQYGSPSCSSNFLSTTTATSSSSSISQICSRCSSLLTLASNSRYSISSATGDFVALVESSPKPQRQQPPPATRRPSPSPAPPILCKLCLAEVGINMACQLDNCNCSFCTECMRSYVEFEIAEGAYDISCPDAKCRMQGVLSMEEIERLVGEAMLAKHKRYRLNREIELDKTRTWCPRIGCETVCSLCPNERDNDKGSLSTAHASSSTANRTGVGESSVEQRTTTLLSTPLSHRTMPKPCTPQSVHCPTCATDFCSNCKLEWHPGLSCDANNKRLAKEGKADEQPLIGIPFDSDLIKCCPMCNVPIEKDEGCAQMMCKRCKHVFCWYCLASLDDDFLLRHYDKGPCKNKLGHSRASVIWHRAQVIGIFAGFGILLLLASPLLLLAAPCIVCCKCRVCNASTSTPMDLHDGHLIEEEDEDEEVDSGGGDGRGDSGGGLVKYDSTRFGKEIMEQQAEKRETEEQPADSRPYVGRLKDRSSV